MADCVFCKIVRKEVPSQTVYETDNIIAIKDLHPASEGHTLVIPKAHSVDIFDTPQDLLREVIAAVKEISQKMRTDQNIQNVNILNCSGKPSGQSVSHFHIHVIPRREGDSEAVVPNIEALLKQK